MARFTRPVSHGIFDFSLKAFVILAAILATSQRTQAQGASFDGVYRGEATSGTGCTTLHPALWVEKGTATLRYNPNMTFEGKVGTDGSLDAPFGQGRLTGKFTDGKFQGSVGNGRCQYPLALAK